MEKQKVTEKLFKELESLTVDENARNENGKPRYTYGEIQDFHRKIENLITSTLLPSDKEDLIDMYNLCKQKAANYSTYQSVWESKFKSVLQKMQFPTYKNDEDIAFILSSEEKEKAEKEAEERAEEEERKKEEEEQKRKKEKDDKNNTIIGIVSLIIFIILIIVAYFCM